MLTNYGGEYPYKMTELYEAIGLNSSNYKRWVKNNLIESFLPLKDYKEVTQVPDNHHSSLGRMGSSDGVFRTEYLLTKRTTEELALLSRTQKGKELRSWLLDLKDKFESSELMTMKQFYFLMDLVRAFSFVVNQKAIEEAHKQKFIYDFIDKQGRFNIKQMAAQFHIYRNEMLGISPEQIEERVLRFCDEEQMLIDKDSKREILAIIDKYSLIGNAAFDFMSFINKTESIALDVSEKVKGIAEKMNIEMKNENKADLFGEELELRADIMFHVNPFVKDKSLRSAITEKLNQKNKGS